MSAANTASSSSSDGQEILLVKRPHGSPTPDIWQHQSYQPPSDIPSGHVLIKLKALSVDPYLRGVMRTAPLNAPLTIGVVAEVMESKNNNYKSGDLITGYAPMRTIQVIDPAPFKSANLLDLVALGWTQVNKSSKLPVTAWLGAVGMPGRTAYFGLTDPAVGNLQSGQTVLISGSAGAVGSLAGQIAKLRGAKRVIGTAGGKEKCAIAKQKYGYDEVIDYKENNTKEKIQSALKLVAPDGIDLYFDNTGGHVTEAVWDLLNSHAHVAICGQISSYNSDDGEEEKKASPLLSSLLWKCVTVRGFLVGEFSQKYSEFNEEIVPLAEQGKIQFDETRYNGFQSVPEAFEGLFNGRNTGKAVVVLE